MFINSSYHNFVFNEEFEAHKVEMSEFCSLKQKL